MHMWGDENFDWKSLNEAMDIVRFWATKIGRIGGDIKEKFGTLRFYAKFSFFSIHDLLYPGYYVIKLPKLYWFEYKYLRPTIYKLIQPLFNKYQMFFYNFAYKRAVNKFPHIRLEILCMADYLECLPWAVKTEGNRIYIKQANGKVYTNYYRETIA